MSNIYICITYFECEIDLKTW